MKASSALTFVYHQVSGGCLANRNNGYLKLPIFNPTGLPEQKVECIERTNASLR